MGKKVYKRENITIIEYPKFNDFLEIVKGKRVKSRNNISNKKQFNFSTTNSLREAVNLMLKGDAESFNMIIKVKKLTDALFKVKTSIRPKEFLSVEGYHPNIPNAVLNIPTAMHNKRDTKGNKKVIDVFYNASIPHYVKTDDIVYRGALLLSAIQTLETRGYSINLYVGEAYQSSYFEILGYFTKLKDSTQRINVFKLSFYLVNPSFLRRIGFKVTETEDNLPDVTYTGYGSVITDFTYIDRIKEIIYPDLVIFDFNTNIWLNNSDEENLEIIKNLFGGKL